MKQMTVHEEAETEVIEASRYYVYIETSTVSYLTARPASDLLATAWQNAS